MSPAEPTKLATRQWRCATCGVNVSTPHCPSCGEKRLEGKDLTFMGLIGQVFQAVTSVAPRQLRRPNSCSGARRPMRISLPAAW